MATGVDTELVEFLERLKYGEYAGCITGILWQLACRQCDFALLLALALLQRSRLCISSAEGCISSATR